MVHDSTHQIVDFWVAFVAQKLPSAFNRLRINFPNELFLQIDQFVSPTNQDFSLVVVGLHFVSISCSIDFESHMAHGALERLQICNGF